MGRIIVEDKDEAITFSSTSITKQLEYDNNVKLFGTEQELYEKVSARLSKFESTIDQLPDSNESVLSSPLSTEILENALLLNTTHSACLKLVSKVISGFGYYFEGKKNKRIEQIISRPNNEIGESFGTIVNNLVTDFKKRGEFGLAVKKSTSGEIILKYLNINNLRIIPYGNVVSTSVLIKEYVEIQDNIDSAMLNNTVTATARRYKPLRWDTIMKPNEWYLARYWTPSSRNLFFPEPEYLSALYPIAENKKIYDYNSVFFDNNARPDFVFVIKGVTKIGNIDKTNIQDFVANNFKGRLNAHRTLFLQFDDRDVAVEVIPVNQKTNNDASFRELKMDNRDDIARAWGVPPKVIGISSAGSLGSGSEALGALKLLKEAAKPDQKTIEEFLSSVLKKVADSKDNPKLKLRRIELTNEKDKAIIYNLLAGLTDNEDNPILPYENVANDLDLECDTENKRFVISTKKDNLYTNRLGNTRSDGNGIDERNKDKAGNTDLN